MPRTVSTLRTMEHATQAYILTIDGLSICYTNDNSGELVGSGGNSYIARAESDLGETVGDRTMVAGLELPEVLEFGSDTDSLGLGRTTARFSVLLTPETFAQLIGSGEEPTEMLGRLAPTDDPAPATVVGVTVRDRHIGLEYIGSSGERRMFPFLVGETLQGYDHHGDLDGEAVASSVSTRPLVHEGRLCALYRVYRDPSATSTSGSLAWPSLSNYSPIWVGKMRDAGTITAGGRISIECTGFESLLERNMATLGGSVFGVQPEFTADAGVDDQVAVYLAMSEHVTPAVDFQGAKSVCRGREWTTLSGSTRDEIRDALDFIMQETSIGNSVDYNVSGSVFSTLDGAIAGLEGGALFVRRDARSIGDNYRFAKAIVAMHRRRWLALGFDPEQQDHDGGLNVAMPDQQTLIFRKLTSGEAWEPESSAPTMGAVPGPEYYAAEITTIPHVYTSSVDDRWHWDNDGARRYYFPLFEGADLVRVIKPEGGQVLRLSASAVLMPQSHLNFEGSIDGTACDAAGWFMIRGKIRKADGETDDQSLVVEDEVEQAVIARCSWVQNGLFADIVSGASPALYIEELVDPRKFGYPFRPLDRDWATLDLQAVQLRTWATGATNPEPVGRTLSAMLRSTGTSTGPDGGGVIDQGDNSGTATGWYGDIFSAEMGIGIPSTLLPTQSEIVEALEGLPGGDTGDLARCRPAYEASFSSLDAMRAMLEPRGLRVGFDGGRFTLYRMRDASHEEASLSILEDDLYGTMGDPTSVYPQQRARALAPVDAWEVSYAGRKHRVRASDPGASMRRGDNVVPINGLGLISPELYSGEPGAAPLGAMWREEARVFFGEDEASFRARRHGMITLPVSRPKGQDLYPGTVVTLSNPWVWSEDGTQGVSSVVGRVIRARHFPRSAHCEADILVFEGQWQFPALYAPALWIEAVVSSTSLTIATSSDFTMGGGSTSGWTQPEWSTGEGGNLVASLWRQLPDSTWVEVGQAEVSSVNATTVTLATALSSLPPDNARTMLLTLAPMALQPAWAQEFYSAVGIQGDNTRNRRFT